MINEWNMCQGMEYYNRLSGKNDIKMRKVI